MNTISVVLMLLAVAAVAASFIIGMFFMVRSGDADRVKSNKLMWIRVYLQGFALAMFAIVMATSGKL